MKNKPTISKIVLEIGDQTVEMTLDQARELLDVLQDTFGEKSETVIVASDHHHYWSHWKYSFGPTWMYRPSTSDGDKLVGHSTTGDTLRIKANS